MINIYLKIYIHIILGIIIYRIFMRLKRFFLQNSIYVTKSEKKATCLLFYFH